MGIEITKPFVYLGNKEIPLKILFKTKSNVIKSKIGAKNIHVEEKKSVLTEHMNKGSEIRTRWDNFGITLDSCETSNIYNGKGYHFELANKSRFRNEQFNNLCFGHMARAEVKN